MSKIIHLAFLLLLAAPGGAEELRLIYERHKAVSSELGMVFKTIVLERETYGQAADRDAQLAKWGASLDLAKRLNDEQDKLEVMYRGMIGQRQTAEISAAIYKALHGAKALGDPSSTVYEDTKRGEIMDGLSSDFKEFYSREYAAYQDAVRMLAARRSAERRRRTVMLGLLGTGAAGAAVLLGRGFLGPRKAVIIHPADQPPVPKLIAGNIEVKGLIGRGAMGEVYEAIDKTLGRRVALKRLRSELLASRADLERLLAEARVVASLKHPNLVAIYSVERDAGQVYLAFEFVDGNTLARTIEERGRLGWPEALLIFQSVCSALHYAHSHRIIHRDLKPANIMLAHSGEVKVMDFGIAHEAHKSISRLTRAAAWGTPPYMAPEQELGGVAAGVDLFALSVCLYEMLTGELPFKGPNFLAQKREGLCLPASGLVANLPMGADSFFAAALAPEPSKRFPTAAALAAAAAAVS